MKLLSKLILFFVKSPDSIMKGQIIEKIKTYGFEVLNKIDISASLLKEIQQSHFLQPWVKNAERFSRESDQLSLIVAVNLNPMPPSFIQKHLYFAIDDARVLYLANGLRQSSVFTKGSFILFSTRNETDATHISKIFFPDYLPRLLEKKKRLENEYKSPYEPLSSLSQERFSAKIELINHHEKTAVQKVFRPSALQQLKNEITAYSKLSLLVEAIPSPLEVGENYIVLPFYKNILSFKIDGLSLFPLQVAEKTFFSIKSIFNHGYSYLDSHPGNVILTKDNQLMLIDFEFLQKYSSQPASFDESYDIQGYSIEPSSTVCLPSDIASFKTRWEPYLGLNYDSFVNDPSWLKKAKRAVFWCKSRLPRYFYRRLRTGLRFLLACCLLSLRSLFKNELFKNLNIRMRP